MAGLRRRHQVVEPPPPAAGVWQVPARFNFVRDVVEALAAVEPRRPALTFVGRDGVIDRRTFVEVAAEANRWAALLRARGLAPGDRLLVCLGGTPTWPAVLLGALKAGLVTVPCPETSGARDLAFRAEHVHARLVVADHERAPAVALLKGPVEVVLVEDAASELRQHSVVQPTHDTAADDPAFILYTSGTTRPPQGAIHSHGFTWAQRLQAEHWLDAHPGDLVWCTAETGSATSIGNVLLGPWSRRAQIMIHERGFDPEQRLDLLQRLGVTVLCQAPSEYRRLAQIPDVARSHLGRLRHAVSIGEALEPDVFEAFHEALGLEVCEGYGQTESAVLAANVRGAAIKPGSIGLPTPGHDLAVIDEAGNAQPAGVEGDLALRGRPPSLFLGYWEAPDETDAAFRGEWYLTGDRATCDEDGYLWLTGRAPRLTLRVARGTGSADAASPDPVAAVEGEVLGGSNGNASAAQEEQARKTQAQDAEALALEQAGQARADAAARVEAADAEAATAQVAAAERAAREEARRVEEVRAAEAAERARLAQREREEAARRLAEAERERELERVRQEEQKRREEERRAEAEAAAAEQAAREEAQRLEKVRAAHAAERARAEEREREEAAKRLAAAEAAAEQEAARRRREEEERRAEKEEAAAARAFRDAEERREAEGKEQEARSRTEAARIEAEAQRRVEAERRDDGGRPVESPAPGVPPPSADAGEAEGARPGVSVVERLRAYGRREHSDEQGEAQGTDAARNREP